MVMCGLAIANTFYASDETVSTNAFTALLAVTKSGASPSTANVPILL